MNQNKRAINEKSQKLKGKIKESPKKIKQK